jgi:hypothetical protein
MKNFYGTPYSATATGSTSAVATQNGVALQTIYVTDISGSSDKVGSKILVKDGSTVIWQDFVGSNTSVAAYNRVFTTPLKATIANTITVTVDGTATCNANLSGFITNNS